MPLTAQNQAAPWAALGQSEKEAGSTMNTLSDPRAQVFRHMAPTISVVKHVLLPQDFKCPMVNSGRL